MGKKIFFLIILVLLGYFAYSKFVSEDGWLCKDGQWIKHGNPSVAMPTTGCGEKPTTPNPDKPQPDENTGVDKPKIPQNNANIIVEIPKSGDELTSPFKITGQARVFENQFNYRLKDKDGNVLTEGAGYANAPDMGQFGNFDIDVNYTNPSDTAGNLEVFDNSAKDGSEIDMVSIPVKLKASDTLTIKVYFNSSKLDPEVSCNKVFPVDRVIPKTVSTAKAAVEELLKGPTENEKADGYTTSINPGVKLNKISITDGTATADFDETLQYQVGGSCRVSSISAEITQTLKQFSSIKEVLITINGKGGDEILQP